jgi:SulP family sulfate permease
VTFIYRISSLTRAEVVTDADYPALSGHKGQIQAFRVYGALFFGAVKLIENMEDHLPQKALVLDLKNVLYIDSSGADTMVELQRNCEKQSVRLVLCGLHFQPLDILTRCGLVSTMGDYASYPHLHAAIDAATHYAYEKQPPPV